VRELLVHFRTRTNTDDIEAALQETLQKFQHQTGLPTRLQREWPRPAAARRRAGAGAACAAGGAVQRAQARQASHVSLDVVKGPRWRFVVRDNGAGFRHPQQPGA
jgi:two-component system, NarL family, nitrate/nitrite sensor histidine kinase NarX